MTSRQKISRREFVGTGLKSTAAALALPYIVPSTVLGKNGSVSPSEKITLGFIGVGWKGFEGCWGSLLQSFIKMDDCRILAVCDIDENYLNRAKKYVDNFYKNRDCKTYVDFREVISRGDIDAVVIATPDHWHAIQAIQACKNGKDVYCEKPLSLTIEEGRAMVNAARRFGRIVQTGSQSRSNARLKFNCEAIKNGMIGEIKSMIATCGGPPVIYQLPEEPTPSNVHWDMWVGPSPYRPFSSNLHPLGFRSFYGYGGGGIADWGAHHFDIAQWALGMDNWGPVEVIPPQSGKFSRLKFRYENGIELTHIDIHLENKIGEIPWGVTVEGTEGKIVMEGISGASRYTPASLGEKCRAEVVKSTALEGNSGHYENFIDCVKTRKRPNADIETGARSVSMSHMATIAYWMSRPLKWDPAAEHFIDDPEANRYLGRTYREPWRL